jgi:hypothetical protein
LFTGNLAFPSTSAESRDPPTSIPHCSAQYGQWVAIDRSDVAIDICWLMHCMKQDTDRRARHGRPTLAGIDVEKRRSFGRL